MGEFISGLIIDLVCALFGVLQNIDLSPVLTAIETLTPYFQFALFILPAETIAQIFSIIVAIWSMRLTIKAIKVFWELIPIL